MSQLTRAEVLVLMKETLVVNQDEPQERTLDYGASLTANGIDSLMMILLFSALEERAGMPWEPDEIAVDRYQTVDDLVDYLIRRQG